MRYRGRAAAALVALLVAAVTTLVVPVAVRRMIDFGFDAEHIGLIDQYFGVMIAVVGRARAGERLALLPRDHARRARGGRPARRRVRAISIALSAPFFDTARTGELISRLTADTTQIKSAVGSSVSVALRNIVLFLGSAAMMVVTSPKLSGFVLAAIPVIVLPLVGFGRSVRRRSRTAQDTLADASAYAAELIGAVRTLQAFTNEPLARRPLSPTRSSAPIAAAIQSTRARAILTAIIIFLASASVVVMLWVGAQDVIAGRHDARAAQPVRALCGVRRERARAVERGLGRAVAGRGRRRAADRAARRSSRRSSAPAHPVPLPQRAARRGRVRGGALRLSGAAGGRRARRRVVPRASPARRSRSSAPPARARARSST